MQQKEKAARNGATCTNRTTESGKTDSHNYGRRRNQVRERRPSLHNKSKRYNNGGIRPRRKHQNCRQHKHLPDQKFEDKRPCEELALTLSQLGRTQGKHLQSNVPRRITTIQPGRKHKTMPKHLRQGNPHWYQANQLGHAEDSRGTIHKLTLTRRETWQSPKA